LVAVSLGKRRRLRLKRAVHLVGTDMQEAKAVFLGAFQCIPVATCRLKQCKGTHDVRLDKILRAMDRTIHMAFGGKVENSPRVVACKNIINQRAVSDITPDEYVSWIALKAGEVFLIPGIRKLIKVDNRLIMVPQPIEYKIAANKTGAAGDKYAQNQIFRKIAANASPTLSSEVCRYTLLRISCNNRMGSQP